MARATAALMAREDVVTGRTSAFERKGNDPRYKDWIAYGRRLTQVSSAGLVVVQSHPQLSPPQKLGAARREGADPRHHDTAEFAGVTDRAVGGHATGAAVAAVEGVVG
jgi:hypothetical protein